VLSLAPLHWECEANWLSQNILPKSIVQQNAQVHIMNCSNFTKLAKMVERKQLHSSIKHKIKLKLEIASLKELVLGLL